MKLPKKICAVIIALLFIIGTLPAGAAGAADAGGAANAQPPGADNAFRWYLNSAEMIAVYREIFYSAECALVQQSKDLKPNTWGVVMDVDETILSSVAQRCEWFRSGLPASGTTEDWQAWVQKRQSTLEPGCRRYMQLVKRLGGYISLVSNRFKQGDLQATIDNLHNYGLPFDQVLLFDGKSGDKNARFNAVISGKAPSVLPAQIILQYIGDNIQDFPDIRQPEIIKLAPDGSAYDNFGSKYFVLPNPTYGSWEKTPWAMDQ